MDGPVVSRIFRTLESVQPSSPEHHSKSEAFHLYTPLARDSEDEKLPDALDNGQDKERGMPSEE